MFDLGHYILTADHRVVPCRDVMDWAQWFGSADRRVALTDIPSGAGVICVSTIFLGLDHNFGEGEPLLFETMVFGTGDEYDPQERCSTWDEAVAMHARWVRRYQSLKEAG